MNLLMYKDISKRLHVGPGKIPSICFYTLLHTNERLGCLIFLILGYILFCKWIKVVVYLVPYSISSNSVYYAFSSNFVSYQLFSLQKVGMIQII